MKYNGGHVHSPWVSPDNLRMYYLRTEPGSYWRIKFTQRNSESDPWGAPTNISEINALGHVTSPSLTADELAIFFMSSDVAGNVGSYDIYMADRVDKSQAFGNVRNLGEVNTSASEARPGISPDGLTLYFSSNRKDRKSVV